MEVPENMKKKSKADKEYLIADLEIIKMGDIHKEFGYLAQSYMFCYVKDENDNHYIFFGSTGCHGECYDLFPYDCHSQNYPDITNHSWCFNWMREQQKKITDPKDRRFTLILNNQDHNRIMEILQYRKKPETLSCSYCWKENVENWYHVGNGHHCCAECLESLKKKYSCRY